MVKQHITVLKGKGLVCNDEISIHVKAVILKRTDINLLTMSDEDKAKIHKKCLKNALKTLNAKEEKYERETRQMHEINKWIMNDEHTPTKTYEKGSHTFGKEKVIIKKIFEAGLYYYTNRGYLRWDEVYGIERESFDYADVEEVGRLNKYARNRILQREFESLIWEFQRGDLKLNPIYQRERVWSDEDKISLIESLLDEIPIGRIAIRIMQYPDCRGARGGCSHTNETGQCALWEAYYRSEIVDGKQRFSTIYEFMQDQFQVRGLYYREMCGSDRRRIHHFTIPVVEADYKEESDILEWFIALNTVGRPQNPVHLDSVRKQLRKQLKKE